MRVRAILLAAGLVAASPAQAIHDTAIEDALGFCVTDAFTLVEAIITYREGIEVAVRDIGPQPGQVADTRVVEAVQAATQAGVNRMLDALGSCMEPVAGRLAPNPAAYTQAQAIEAELEFARDEIDGLREALDAALELVLVKWGANATAPATRLLSSYFTFASDLGEEIALFMDDVKVITDATRPR